jgi:muramoyltetrapeptide carboxypeptidase
MGASSSVPALPAPLRSGDRVRLVAASSALESLDKLAAGIEILRGWGLEVGDPRGLLGRRWGSLAGSDAERLDDLLGQDADGRVPALLACVRGGWGSARLLEGQGSTASTWRDPLAAPQWLLGFSDVTSLLWAHWAEGWGGGIHGPLLTTLASEPAWSQERLRGLLFGDALPPLQGDSWTAGIGEGPLLVGNLTVATHLLGTPHMPNLKGAIAVFEDVGEAPYRIERMLTHWRVSGALGQLAGIGWGSFTGCVDGERASGKAEAAFTTEQVLRERTADLGIPVVANLPVGHAPGNAALPVGVWARLDGTRGRLELEATWQQRLEG